MLEKNRNFGLDLIRAFSILFVLIGHGYSHLLGGKFPFIFSFIDGVDVFFVLSGYLIGGIFIKDFITRKNYNWKDIVYFWKRRWLRTLPAYYVSFLIIFLLGLAGLSNFSDFSFAGLFFFQNFFKPQPIFFSASWSLSVEEWAYLVLPLFMYLFMKISGFRLLRNNVIIVCLVIIILLPLFYRIRISEYFLKWHDQFIWDTLFRKRVITRIDSIFLGVLGAYIYHFYSASLMRLKVPLLISGLILIYINNFWATNFWKYTFYFTVNSIAIFCVFPFFISLKQPASIIRLPVAYISKVSYSIYLLHFNGIMYVVLSFYGSDRIYHFNAFLVYIALSFISAHILYSLVEKPFMNIRDRYSR